MNCKIKLLSGALSGVEFTVEGGDTVFHVGPHRDLVDGVVARTIAFADNTFYISDERQATAFMVRISVDETVLGQGGSMNIELGERCDNDQWRFRIIPRNTVDLACGIHFAVRNEGEAWSKKVLDFRPMAKTAAVSMPKKRGNARWASYGLACAVFLGIVLGGYALYQHHVPEIAKVQGLVEVLRGSPADYDVVYGSDGHLYAFTDTAQGVAWGQRAGQRLQRGDADVFLQRSSEAERLGQFLTRAGFGYTVIRLQDPQHPEVVLSGGQDVTPSLKERVLAVIAEHMPYARAIKIESISDAHLVALARERLRSLGIPTRVDSVGTRVSISNDIFLDDASLHAMARYIQEFGRYWGDRRIAINIRLWDDLLKGRSYQYSPDQLLSVGDGRWEFSRAVEH
ncbi:PrgH/EprH family type III secretion apparatus protein [Dyella sp. Tek66A03]|uniref:PrgH/EprH family type III secretion apparatus protein n=1 Tax=Dyella sp. Tek66A03 TaxID=3458298 RepID=UPI00403EA29C